MNNTRQTGQAIWKTRVILFLVSQCITLFGSTLVQMAIVWYITLQTSSGAWVAACTVCSYLPQFLISFMGGVWADRYSRKKLIIVADAGIAITTLIMILIMPLITAEFTLLGALLAMSAIRSFGAGIQMPAVNAIIPQLVPENQLMRWNGINATMQSIVQFAAPAAAGTLLTIGTLRATLLVDLLTAAAGIGLLTCILIPWQKTSKDPCSVFANIKTGLRYAFSQKLLGGLLIVYGLFIFLCVPAGFLSQLFVSRVYGDTYWYLTAVELVGFAGMAAGGLLMGTWGGFKKHSKTLAAGLAVFGILAAGMGFFRNFVLYLVLMLFYGVALTVVQTVTTTLIQKEAETAMQGRVFGLLSSMYAGFLPIGMAVLGPLADIVPLQWVMAGSGVVLILIAGIVYYSRRFKELAASVQ